MLAGYDIISYVDYSPASYLFLHLPRVLRRTTKAVFHAEAPLAQMVNPSRSLRCLSQGVLPRCDVYTGITQFVARDIFPDREEEGGATFFPLEWIRPSSALPRNASCSTPVVLLPEH